MQSGWTDNVDSYIRSQLKKIIDSLNIKERNLSMTMAPSSIKLQPLGSYPSFPFVFHNRLNTFSFEIFWNPFNSDFKFGKSQITVSQIWVAVDPCNSQISDFSGLSPKMWFTYLWKSSSNCFYSFFFLSGNAQKPSLYNLTVISSFVFRHNRFIKVWR